MSNKNPLPTGSSSIGMHLSEEAIARTHILSLINRYASFARGIPDQQNEIAVLFEPNATILLPDGRELSPLEIGKITENNTPKLLRHHVTTVDVQWDDVVVRSGDGRCPFKRKVIVVDGMDAEGWLSQTVAEGVEAVAR
ncbi:hypothetical protein TSTA_001010 [Talaromyces stipitatus ATCC 10500]|uniref:SnoaL-like domain-containing protein n=1 Tax=Talaromyces stipitatus (strain ATCC 10500 / CBS 375.48 / QM 6759 / NRRL 1006) TaxID=441959 RepID=B8MT04_TALSN|nr:uncharacterized protein TSTA_001010 [Talaromyces stipitatus ATCC 10500]EED12029.1 hypothetical protein TSTA_001010 [Talaromyces stipitatus ATCC 10500]